MSPSISLYLTLLLLKKETQRMNFKREHFSLLDKVVLGRAIFKPPFKASSALENEARFVHIIKGNTRLYAPQSRLNLSSGDNILMRCENFVNNWLANEDNQPSEVMIIHFYPEVLQFIYDNKLPELFTLYKEVNPNPVEKIANNEMIDNYIASLRFYFDNKSYLTDDLLKIKLKEIIHILVSSDQSGTTKTILSNLFQNNEYEFKEIIHSNLFEDLSMEDLAFFAGLSLSSFKRKFKAVFGSSPARYIKTKRLEKAQKLLKKTTLRVSEIAYDCGFNDIGHFSKSFNSAYHLTPTEYRKQLLS